MKIIEPSVELVDDFDAAAVMRKIERAGRVCYKSEGNIKPESAEKFIRGIIKRGHESVIEHASVSFKIVCDRGVTHELVRHRIASYCVTGDTIIPSYVSRKGRVAKKRTIETIYKWSLDSKCQAVFQQLVVRSFDEQTRSVVPNKIKKVFFNGIKDVFEITTASGRSLKCTDGHRFFTDGGWKTLAQLEVGNLIYVNGLSPLENEDWLRHNYLTLNKTRKQLAQEIGCSESTLYKAFKKFGIKKPLSRPYAVGAFKDKIVSINYVGKEKVYDLEMSEPYPNYVANSIIVHNSQESTRFCDYSAGKFGGELTFIRPCFWSEGDENFHTWLASMESVERNYLAMRANGAKPEEARSILPNSLKTEIFVTMNLRELRHFLKLRTAQAAHPQMRQIALKMLDILVEKLPAVFADIKP
ncbi:MAG: FAD-dependent thymidylate synthase [Selenomonadaceae bacterium]|nr:FAD-dependent thymidylate synthase [Selenomonadaceae bacterium]